MEEEVQKRNAHPSRSRHGNHPPAPLSASSLHVTPYDAPRVCAYATYPLSRIQKQGALLALHYCLLAALVPLPVAIGHIFLGGWLTATLVTVTHTAEEYAVEDDTSYVETQFRTTRDAVTEGAFSE